MLVDLRGDVEREKRAARKLMRFTAFVAFPLLFGFGMVAREFIVLAITDKWLESAVLIQMLCVSGAFMPLTTLLSNVGDEILHPADLRLRVAAQTPQQLFRLCRALLFLILPVAGTILLLADVDADVVEDGRRLQNELGLRVQPLQRPDGRRQIVYLQKVVDAHGEIGRASCRERV